MFIPQSTTWIELDTATFNHNLYHINQTLSPRTLAPVIKCNAYGHGLVEIGLLCDMHPQVSLLCVAFLSEALNVRNAGIKKPILVLTDIDADPRESIGKNISFVVDNHEQIHALHTLGMQYKQHFDIHIKIDTGLGRRGIQPRDIISFVSLVKELPFIRIAGICSHFAQAYETQTQKTDEQYALFANTLKEYAQYTTLPQYIHVSNSSLRYAHYTSYARVGIACYGYLPLNTSIPLTPVLSLKSKIFRVYDVPVNTPIGYDGTYTTTQASRLALIPVGYYHGYDRRLSNKGFVHVNGSLAPIRGLIAMNCMTIDITHIPQTSIGDEVTLLGNKGGVRAFDLVQYGAGNNMRETLTRLNPLIPRILV